MICYISGIRLPQSGLTTVLVGDTPFKVCTHLLREWILFAGPIFWDGTPIQVPDGFVQRTTLSSSKSEFFKEQFSGILDILLFNETLDEISAFTYIKVLLGAALRHDTILTGILVCEIHLCIKLLLSDPFYDIPGEREESYELLAELADLFYATFVCLVQESPEMCISVLNAFGKVSVQSILYLPMS